MKDFTYIITNRMDGDRNIYGVLTGNEGFERAYDIYMEVFEGELEIWKDNQFVGIITPNNCSHDRDEFNSDLSWMEREYNNMFWEDPMEKDDSEMNKFIENLDTSDPDEMREIKEGFKMDLKEGGINNE